MAEKEVTNIIKLQIEAGKATPAPPVGPALGSSGVNIMQFVKEFNDRTANQNGMIIPVVITVYKDKSFEFITKEPPMAVLIKKAAKIEKASGKPNREKVAKLTKAQVEEIAKQKAGIIKENSETVYMEQESNIDDIIEKTCKEKQNILHIVKQSEIKNQRFENDREIFDYKQYHNIEVNLKGKRQIQNAALVLECCDILDKKGYFLSEEVIRSGLKTVIHKGRFEVMHQNPTIIFDGGHNEQAIENLKETIDLYYKNAKKIFVISVLKSKDYHKIIEDILDKAKEKGEANGTGSST